jgi:adenylate cyclase
LAVEIERKFLVSGSAWRQGKGVRIIQGYLCQEKGRILRVRLVGEKAFLTIKGPSNNGSRPEFEYEIPLADGEEILNLCNGLLIEKIRHVILFQELKWEVDEFLGDNEGLLIAEIELNDVNQPFAWPDWVGKEVTNDLRYTNVNLADHPYCSWKDK